MRIVCLLLAFILFRVTAAIAQPALPPVDTWTVYENARFGYRLVYPGAWFEAGPESPRGDGRAFNTPDGRARIAVFGASNSEAMSLLEYRATVLELQGLDQELTYSPIGNTWFVLSGYQSDEIYYQKVMFSCGGRIINVLSIDFPAAEKPRFAPMIEKVEDRFRTGVGYDTPASCR